MNLRYIAYLDIQVVIRDPQSLVGSSSVAEVNKTDEAGASTTENMTTLENPPAITQESGVLHTNQGKLPIQLPGYGNGST